MKKEGLFVVFLLVLFVSCSFAIASSEFIDLGFTSRTNNTDLSVMPGNLENGFILSKNSNPLTDYLIQFRDITSVSEPLENNVFGLYLVYSSVSISTLDSYYTARGVPEPFLSYLKNATRGNTPFAYINSTARLIDGAMYSIASINKDMTIPGDYPSGIYNVSGKIKNQSGFETNVNFKLIIGNVILNQEDSSCALVTSNITLKSNIIGDIKNVTFTYSINGSSYNVTPTAFGDLYSYTIPSNELASGMNLVWRVNVLDSYGNLNVGNDRSVYINRRTSLDINPSQPDGANGWYVTEPSFSLSNDDANQFWYRWDSMLNNVYTGAFGLENIPNLPKQTAGTLELNYFSNVCSEPNQQKILYVDLTSPQITDLIPGRGEMIYSDKLQLEAYLDEVYGSNSGINKSSVIMKLDNLEVSPQLTSIDAIDVLAKYNVTSSLAAGWHNVSIYAQDFAGNWNMSFWNFYVNLSKSSFNLTINMPNNGNYSSRKTIFNISSTSEVDLSYINYDDESPNWRKLCDDCDEYGKTRERTKTLNEGWNNLIIRGEDSLGNKVEESRAIFIDSKKPKISKTLPRQNSITNGSGFYIKFIEKNTKKVSVSYNQTEIIITNCQDKNQYTECFADLDLRSLDNQEISFWYNVSDGLWNKGSKPRKIVVDTSSPVIGNITTSVSGRYVTFNISINEVNLKEIGYSEIVDNNLKYVKLCSGLRDDSCNVKKSFSYGNHSLTIRAVDDAGNSATRDIEIVI